MRELTQSPEQKPGMTSDKALAPITQTPDFEKAPSAQRQEDYISQLCSIQEDMKGLAGKLDGLFGM
jgi:hypothetical protein